MTAEQIAELGPAFTDYLRGFRPCFVTSNTFGHLGTYCRGLLSDLERKSVEPIALAAGAAVRTLQEFLTHHVWDHDALLTRLQRRIVAEHLPAPGRKGADADELGVVGLLDETSVPKKGEKPPGVQRQYCGARGKVAAAERAIEIDFDRAEAASVVRFDASMRLRSYHAGEWRCRSVLGRPLRIERNADASGRRSGGIGIVTGCRAERSRRNSKNPRKRQKNRGYRSMAAQNPAHSAPARSLRPFLLSRSCRSATPRRPKPSGG